MNKKTLTVATIILWLLISIFNVVKNECILLKGQDVLLETVPVDPRDLLMGDYVILNYKIGQLPLKYIYFKDGTEVYVTLNRDSKDIVSINKIFLDRPSNEFFIKGKIGKCNTTIPFFKTGKCINYGIENYYVKEGTGIQLEQELRKGTLVKAVINANGEAKVKGFVNR